MIDSLISSLAPHYCLSCGEIGEQICENCYFDIELSPRGICFICRKILVASQCSSCAVLRDVTQIVLAERAGMLARLIDDYKFMCTRDTDKIIARLLDDGVPVLPSHSHLIPVPTAPSHVRRRGFDHTYDFVRRFAAARSVAFSPFVVRRHSHAQVGASRTKRQQQATQAYRMKKGVTLDPEAVYVVCDDIVTTGASMAAMITMLRRYGASHIICVALLQQPWQE